ncbi:hypothetical protein SNE40_007476 [Patella caerulea]|uniref:Peptidase S1 domain-containing protein n=1 Tax=Patella caerulea TaxID=87958 RepID=A0AAN8PV22_PATCE
MSKIACVLFLVGLCALVQVKSEEKHYYFGGRPSHYVVRPRPPQVNYGVVFGLLYQLPMGFYNNYICNILSTSSYNQYYGGYPLNNAYYYLFRGKRDTSPLLKKFVVVKDTYNALSKYWQKSELRQLVKDIVRVTNAIAADSSQTLSSENVLKEIVRETLLKNGEGGNAERIFKTMEELKSTSANQLRHYSSSFVSQSCSGIQGQFYCGYIRQLTRAPICSTAYFSSQLYSSCCQQSPFINTQAPPVPADPSTTTTTTTTTLTPITRECGISTTNPAPRMAAFTNAVRQFRIVGGVNTEPCEYPWMVRLQAGNSLCGGTIIDETHIMTAGHCIGSNTAANIKVNAGEYNFNIQEANDEMFDVSAINLHPDYTELPGGAVENDIAILTLSRPLTYSDCVQPICLAEPGDSASLDDTQCTTAGWGTTSFEGSPSPILQEVTVPTFSGALCASNFPNTTPTNTNLQICAGRSEGGADSCQGDSGGPLFCPVNGRYVQFGIVSYGDGCALRGNAGVYTDVGAMTSFINSVI